MKLKDIFDHDNPWNYWNSLGKAGGYPTPRNFSKQVEKDGIMTTKRYPLTYSRKRKL